MKIVRGKVVDGKIEVEGHPFAEGSKVAVCAFDSGEVYQLSPEEEAELLEAMAEIDRGEGRPVEEFLRELGKTK